METILILIATTFGNITLELDPEKAPETVASFVSYVEEGHYDNTVFHRVISNFMIQGGGFTEDMKQKPVHAPVKNEAYNGLKNLTGTIAMARTNAPHSATSQFFINVKDNASLNHTSKSGSGWGYTVFGRVIKGMDVVNKIRYTPTGRKGRYSDVPKTAVIIKSITVISAASAEKSKNNEVLKLKTKPSEDKPSETNAEAAELKPAA